MTQKVQGQSTEEGEGVLKCEQVWNYVFKAEYF